MSTKIEWTNETWNPCVGCSLASPGCTNCYAMKMAHRVGPNFPHYAGLTKLTKGGPVWTGVVRMSPEELLLKPLGWKKPRMIFVNSMSDLFHESLTDEDIDRVFAVMALTPHHTYQVLTKRAERMHRYLTAPDVAKRIWLAANKIADDNERLYLAALAANGGDWGGATPFPLRNVWAGISAEDQPRLEERLPWLLTSPAALRWISAEPLLGPLNLRSLVYDTGDKLPEAMRVNNERCSIDALDGRSIWPGSHYISPTIKTNARVVDGELYQSHGEARRIDWVVAGGESGPKSRPAHPGWFRAIRDQCAAAKVPFFFKQWGNWAPAEAVAEEYRSHRHDYVNDPNRPPAYVMNVGKKRAGNLLDGVVHMEWPR